MAKVPNAVEILNRLSMAHERYRRQTDDRQTDDRRQTDGRAIAYSEREREFTFAKNESKHSEIGPVIQNPIQRELLVCSYVCALHCAQLLHTILHRTDLIVFPLTLQTITTASMMSIWGKGVCSPDTQTHTTDCSTRTTKLVDENMTLEEEIANSILSIHRAANLDSDPALCRHRLTIYFTSKFNCLLARVLC